MGSTFLKAKRLANSQRFSFSSPIDAWAHAWFTARDWYKTKPSLTHFIMAWGDRGFSAERRGVRYALRYLPWNERGKGV
jgi:hypothetical protein